MGKQGFTLIELLIVAAITVVLSGLAIIYSHVGQNQVALSIEESKVAQLVLEAKELSIATYSDQQQTCGYGVHFNYGAGTSYSLFKYDLPSAGEICPSIASATAPGFNADGGLQKDPYTSGSWNIIPSQGVKLLGSGKDVIQDILFYPPNPTTLVSFDGQTFYDASNLPPDGATSGNIYLVTVDGSQSRSVNVSLAGQVNL